MIEGFALSLGTAVAKALSDVTQKRATQIISRDEIVILLQRIFEVLIALAIAGVLWLATAYLPSLSTSTLIFLGTVVLASATNFVAFYCNVRALRLSDVSLVSPISQLTPAVLLVTSPLMIGESVSWGGALGVLVVVSGAYVLGIQRVSFRMQSLYEPLVHLASDRGVRFALLASVLYGVSANFDKIGVTMSDPFVFTIASGVCMSLGIVVYTLVAHPARLTLSANAVSAGMYPGIIGGIGSLLQMIAISIWPVAYVIAVKRLSSVFSVISGSLFFNEKNTAPRLWGAFLMVIGTALIVLYG